MPDRYAVINKGGVYTNNNKTEKWHADHKGKMPVGTVSNYKWYWVDVRNVDKTNSKQPDKDLSLRPMSDAEERKYCSDIKVIDAEQAKQMRAAKEMPGANRSRDTLDDPLPF